jgi:GNAT superfamily N-acetyltransferase
MPGWRGRGIGRAMIRVLEDEAARLGAERLEIGAAASNPRARALYEQLGYAPARVVNMALPLGDEDVTFLEKTLRIS